MRPTTGLLLAISLVLTACQLQPLTQPVSKRSTGDRADQAKASQAPASPGPSASVQPSTAPSPTGTASPSISPSASLPPAVPTTLLKGVVRIDASYVIAVGGGNFVSTNGGTFVATNGGTVIATGGGNVIATGGGNVISVGGGNVISVGGGNVIQTGGGNFRLLPGGPAASLYDAAEVAVGTVLPVKGMGVIPVSLTTRQPIGEPVLTDEKGEYTLKVPESYKDNYVVYAVVPGKDANDPVLNDTRLRYNLVVTPEQSATVQAIDEDTSLATAYVLSCFVARMKAIMIANDTELEAITKLVMEEWNVPTSLKFMIDQLVGDISKNAREAGITKDSPNLDAAAQAAFRAGLAHMDKLYDVEVDYSKATEEGSVGPKESAFGAMTSILTMFRERTQAQRLADPNYYNTLSFIIEANKTRPADQKYVLKRPSDLGEFVVKEYLSTNDGDGFDKTELALEALMPDDPTRPAKETSRLRAAAISILAEIARVLTTDEAAKADVAATLKAYGKAASAP